MAELAEPRPCRLSGWARRSVLISAVAPVANAGLVSDTSEMRQATYRECSGPLPEQGCGYSESARTGGGKNSLTVSSSSSRVFSRERNHDRCRSVLQWPRRSTELQIAFNGHMIPVPGVTRIRPTA